MALAVGCRARPGKSRDNKTGSWRVFKPIFDHEKCSKCGMCRTLCPEGCVHEDAGRDSSTRTTRTAKAAGSAQPNAPRKRSP